MAARYRMSQLGLLLFALAALTGCDSSDPSCRRACKEVEEYAQTGNWNAAPRLTPCGELCAHPVATSFERCCAALGSVSGWLQCEEHATNSVRLSDDQRILWEWILTAISYDVSSDLVQIVGVMALSAGAADCTPEPVVELTYELALATGDSTGHTPVVVTPISYGEYESAKWDAIVERPWFPEVPDLGTLYGGRWSFQEGAVWPAQWTGIYVDVDLLEGAQVSWMLVLPLCHAP